MPHRPPLRLFDNEVRLYGLDELTETVSLLERSQPGRTAAELSNAVFAELAMKRSRRAVDLAAEAIRRARSREPREDIGGSRWQAGTAEVRAWALRAGYEIPADGAIPEHAIAAYNETHPDRPTDALLMSASLLQTFCPRDKEWLQLVETSPRKPSQ